MDPLFPFQQIGAKFLAERRFALLADEMGLGKTPQAIRACDLAGDQRIIVICPAVARVNWARAFEKFSPFSRSPQIIRTRSDKPGLLTIASYELGSKLLADLKAIKPDRVIWDESHFLKSLDSKRSAAYLGKDGLIHSTKAASFLSGTPAPNHHGEMWTLLHVAGVYPYKYERFVQRFCKGWHDGFQFSITGSKNNAALRELLGNFMLRRKKVDVLTDLPPITFQDYVVEPGEVDLDVHFGGDGITSPHVVHKDIHDQVEAIHAVLSHAAADDVPGIIMAMAKKTPTVRRFTGLAKVPAIIDLAKQALDGGLQKLVIFAMHKAVINSLTDALRVDYGAVSLFGGTPDDTRQKNIDRFQTNPKCRVFIGQIVAAGTNITLTASHTVWIVEADTVPGNNAQAVMRCHRIGQTQPVTVTFFGLAGSYDERVQVIYRRKTEELAATFD